VKNSMNWRLTILCFSLLGATHEASAQEANSGLDLAATVSAQVLYSRQLSSPPRNAGDAGGTYRAVLYPTWKVNQNWSVSAAVEAYSYPYFFEDLATDKHGSSVNILHADVNYSRFWQNRSVVVRAGQLSPAFGSFLLRYDDAVNPLVDVPPSYGYYLRGVSTSSLAGVEVDTTIGTVDLRGQLVNSSPTNPRSVAETGQYLNWVAGAGYTIRQGLRVGFSAYRGPYLDRQYPFFFPGEIDPRNLPATAVGVDAQWGVGHWNFNGEWQHFRMDYTVIAPFTQSVGYGELRLAVHPRWYLASRVGYVTASTFPGSRSYEAAVGYRAGKQELVKLEYEMQQGPGITAAQQNTLAIQFVTTLGPIPVAHH
jgi:hypothetical protein